MPTSPALSALLEALDQPFGEGWNEKVSEPLAALAQERGTRLEVAKEAKEGRGRLQLRANVFKSIKDAPHVALIPPGQDSSGAYGGLSFVVFPSEKGPSLIGWVVGTQSLEPDQMVLGRPGHARKAQAIARYLNFAARPTTGRVAWAKNDPTFVDRDAHHLPHDVLRQFENWSECLETYGHVVHLLYAPTGAGRYSGNAQAEAALKILLDTFLAERGQPLKKQAEEERQQLRSSWMRELMPSVNADQVHQLLRERRFVVLEGPPGTGKTRMATEELLADRFKGNGKTIQFHANSTYESFVGGLAPEPAASGLAFKPKPGHLIEAIAAATKSGKDYLLHVDELNRADLAKVLGECIYLFEAGAPDRELELEHEYRPVGRKLRLPHNLFLLGTMNASDRSIAPIDLAVRRRFAFASIWPQPGPVEAQGDETLTELFNDLLEIFIDHATEEAFALVPGHSYFLYPPGQKERSAKRLLSSGLRPLLGEYLRQGLCAGFADEIRSFIERIDVLPE